MIKNVKTNSGAEFSKSDVGAQSAWKGFSSQTLYIASQIASDTEGLDFFPEDIEDLVVKKSETVVASIQVKNIASNLTLSSLASSKSSQSGEGFFKRACGLHAQYPDFSSLIIVYFNQLGDELLGLVNQNEDDIEKILNKLMNKHKLSWEDAEWLISSLSFEKVDIDTLNAIIADQLKDCVPVMAAPDLAQSLLIQYVSELSREKGNTSRDKWREKIHDIGSGIAAIDGYYKEYQKSLIRLCDLTTDKSDVLLGEEFRQGTSAHPAHIRSNLDFYRVTWMENLTNLFSKNKAVIVKGVSGQGKSSLCYRFLIDSYPEQLVFCIRSIVSVRQAENLAAAIKGISKNSGIVVYIDVNPGDQSWVLLVQELQARGVLVPVLVSIREEDFNMTRIDGTAVALEIVDLFLSKEEAMMIYENNISCAPHPQFRSFEEAWKYFGEKGPFIEFVYLLTNNQTLKQRLYDQIENLLREDHPDSWFQLLQLVCYAGSIGCPLEFTHVKKVLSFDNGFSAIQRFSNEYLLRKSDDGQYLEALHPVRAQIICDILSEKIGEDCSSLMLSSVKCIDSRNIQLLLMEHFTKCSYSNETILELATIEQRDWVMCSGLIRTMLWLDAKRYAEKNSEVINDIVKKYGSAWSMYVPYDITGLIAPNKTMVEQLSGINIFDSEKAAAEVSKVKGELALLHLDYEATDAFISNCVIPTETPSSDKEWSMLGYSLFWFSIRNRMIEVPHINKIQEYAQSGDIQLMSEAIRGLREHIDTDALSTSIDIIAKRVVEEYQFVYFNITEEEIICHCVPPSFNEKIISDAPENFNHYWKNKVLDILSKLYPQAEYVGVTLLGVNMLKSLGIEPLDYKVRIHKDNRPEPWITEVNSWAQTRTNYWRRPDSWGEFIVKVDSIRIAANSLAVRTISFLDSLYKKQSYTKEGWERLYSEITDYKDLLFTELLLPKIAVDKYCLLSEATDKTKQNSMRIEIDWHNVSTDRYKLFRKNFGDTFRNLEYYFNQFIEVLLARVQRQSLQHIKNPRLPLINLFNATKELLKMQEEYNSLFKGYTSLTTKFDIQETETALTLLNVWWHIFENPIKRYKIAYDAKQLYRHSKEKIRNAFEQALRDIEGTAYYDSDNVYILKNFDPFSGMTLEEEYAKVVLKLRAAYSSALPFNSIRHSLETSNQELFYVALYRGVPLLSGFAIPTYRMLDTDEERISKPLYPKEIPDELYHNLNMDFAECKQWRLSIGYMGAIQMLIGQYNEIVKAMVSFDTTCESGIMKYVLTFTSQLSEFLNEFSSNIKLPLKAIKQVADDDVATVVALMQEVLNMLNDIEKSVSGLNLLDVLEEKLENVSGLMALIVPDILNFARSDREALKM